MSKNKKNILKYFLATISIAIVFCALCIGGASFLILKNTTSNLNNVAHKPQVNTLSTNTGFSTNQYVVIDGKAYKYTQDEQDIITNQDASWGITFNQENTLELIFMKDSAAKLSSFAVNNNEIASVLQATKTETGIEITITDEYDSVNIQTSQDSVYTLHKLALCANAQLNYANNVFSLGTRKGSVGLTSINPEESKSYAQILIVESGSFSINGTKTYSPKTGVEGRAIYQTGGTLTITGVTLTGFTIAGNGGAIYMSGGTLNANGTIKNCKATNGGGGAIYCSAGTINISSGVIGESSASSTATASAYSNYASSNGGGIYLTGSATLNISGTAVISYNCGAAGGGVFSATTTDKINITGGTIKRNYTRSGSGGGIYTYGLTTMTNGTFTHNTANTYGGGIMLKASSASHQIKGGSFTYNTTEINEGGGVRCDGAVTFSGTVSIKNNTAKTSGGGISAPAAITFSAGTVENNTAGGNGGGIQLAGNSTISGGTIKGNTAQTNGGGIYVNKTSTVGGATIQNNTAVNGGGIYMNVATTFKDCTISGNTASTAAPQICVGSGAYITVVDDLENSYVVYKAGLTAYDDNTGNSSIIAYSEAASYLTKAASKLSVSNISVDQQLSTTRKTNYLVCEWKTYYLAINPDNETDEYYNETTYGAYIETAGTFNGTGTFKTVSRNYMYTDKITVNAWAYMSDWSAYANNTMRIFSCTEGGGWNIEPSSSKIAFACYDSGVGYKSIGTSVTWSSLASGWHMFTLTFDGTNARGYLDGTLIGTSAAYTSGKIGYNSNNIIFIGAEAGSNATTPAGSYFNGKIQDFCILNDRLYQKEIENIYSAGTGKIIVSKNYLETYTIDAPIRAGYTFNSWNLSGSGSLLLGQGASSQSGFTRTNNTYYENFKFSVAKPTVNTWYSIRWPKYSFTAGHSYKMMYKIRVNTITGTKLTLRFARLNNDYFGCPSNTYAAATSGWVTAELTQTLNATFTHSGTSKTVEPLFEVYTDNLYSGTANTLVIDFDVKDVVIYDTTTNTIVFASDNSYLFVNGNSTATAQWTANTYYVAFNGNGNTGGSMSNQTHTYDTELALTANAYTKTGYSFVNWNTKPDGSGVTYTDKQSVKNLTITKGATITLYAQWKANTYTLTFNANKPSSASGTVTQTATSTTVTYDSTTNLTSAYTASLTGWTFNGYYTAASDGTQVFTSAGAIKASISGFTDANKKWIGTSSKTVYAQWTANTYTLTFNANKPSAASGTVTQTATSKTVTYDSTTNLTSAYTASLTGWTFKGYYTEASAGTQVFTNAGAIKASISGYTDANKKWVSTSNKTVYAQWTINTYTITYNANGGTISTVGTTSYTIIDNVVMPIISRTGYAFGGWKVDSTVNNWAKDTRYTSGETIDKGKYGNVSLTAQWAANVYKVTLISQGATSAGTTEYYYQFNTTKIIDGVTCYYYTTSDCNTALKDGYYITVPTKTGHTFGGYYTETNGDGTQYVDSTGQCINNIYRNIAGDTTLYPKWTANTYTLTFDANAPSGAVVTQRVSSEQVTYGSSSPLMSNTYSASCTGYIFNGYYTAATGGDLLVDSEGDIRGNVAGFTDSNSCWIGTSDKTVYAQWTTNQYTLHVNTGVFNLFNLAELATSQVDYAPSGSHNAKYTYDARTMKLTYTSTAASDPYIPLHITANLTAGTTYYFHLTALNEDGTIPTATSWGIFWALKDSSFTGSQYFTVGVGDCYASFTVPTTGTYKFRLDEQNANVGTWVISNLWVGEAKNFYERQFAYGSTNTLAIPSRNGYTFKGWQVFGEASFVGNDVTMGAGNATVSAIWETNTYKTTIVSSNTSYGNVSTSTVNALYGTAISSSGATLIIGSFTVSATVIESTGYTTTFSGWTNGSGSVTYDKTITANFSREGKQITLYLDSPFSDQGSPAITYTFGTPLYYVDDPSTASTTITIPTDSSGYYDFKGYYTARSGLGICMVDETGAINTAQLCYYYPDSDSGELYGISGYHYFEVNYSIYYNPDHCSNVGMVVSGSSQGIYYGSGTISVHHQSAVAALYTNLNGQRTSSGIMYSYGVRITIGTYTITVGYPTNATGNSAVTSNPINWAQYMSTTGPTTVVIESVERRMNTLQGYSTSFTYASDDGVLTTGPCCVSLVYFNDNGEQQTTQVYYYKGTATYWSDSSLSTVITKVSVPTKEGYTFTGYYGSNGAIYVNSNGTFSGLCYLSSQILTAQWKVATYTIEFVVNNSNYGSVSVSSITAQHGDMIRTDGLDLYVGNKKVSAIINEVDGYDTYFDGWEYTSAYVNTPKTVTANFARSGKFATILLYTSCYTVEGDPYWQSCCTLTVEYFNGYTDLTNVEMGTTMVISKNVLEITNYARITAVGGSTSGVPDLQWGGHDYNFEFYYDVVARTDLGDGSYTINKEGTYMIEAHFIRAVSTSSLSASEINSNIFSDNTTEDTHYSLMHICNTEDKVNTDSIDSKVIAKPLDAELVTSESDKVNTDSAEVWLDDKFRKLQEIQSTEVDFEGISFST